MGFLTAHFVFLSSKLLAIIELMTVEFNIFSSAFYDPHFFSFTLSSLWDVSSNILQYTSIKKPKLYRWCVTMSSPRTFHLKYTVLN